MNDNLSPEEILAKNLKDLNRQFKKDINKSMKNSEEKEHQLIIEYIKEYMIPIEDKDFVLLSNKEDEYYISLDRKEGEDVYFSLIDSNKPYEPAILIEALLKELLRLWKLERNSVIKKKKK